MTSPVKVVMGIVSKSNVFTPIAEGHVHNFFEDPNVGAVFKEIDRKFGVVHKVLLVSPQR